jgi:hypothetical protein
MDLEHFLGQGLKISFFKQSEIAGFPCTPMLYVFSLGRLNAMTNIRICKKKKLFHHI